MTRPKKPWLDWTREREVLSPFLNRPGGVVRVQSTPHGPLLEFGNVLRSFLDHGNWEKPWTTIQFDPDNANTRYFGEMTRQIERTLALTADLPPAISLGDGSKLGSEMSATEIHITDSFNFGLGDYERSVADERRCQRIVAAIRNRVERESFCLIFVNSDQFNRKDLAIFRDLLWDAGLSELASSGVLLVDLTRSNPRADIEWPPSLDHTIKLDDEYDRQAREDAIADLARFLLDTGYQSTQAEAIAYSTGMLDNHKCATTLYAQLAATFAAGYKIK
jgi:hypothetical protein